MQYIPGPDFPTAGIINGSQGIALAYADRPRPRWTCARAPTIEEDDKGRQAIIITELPYQVNKARLLERIAELVREKIIEGIASDGLRDESDKDGMRVVIELKRGEVADIVLNNLFKHTPMESVFGINMVALQDGQPKVLNLKEMLEAVRAPSPRGRHAAHDLRSAQGARARPHPRRPGGRAREHRRSHRGHQGVAVAGGGQGRVDGPRVAGGRRAARCWRAPVRSSTRPDDLADEFGLKPEGYRLSDAQAQAILDLRLNRLTGAGAGQDRRRVPGAAGADPAISATSWRVPSGCSR